MSCLGSAAATGNVLSGVAAEAGNVIIVSMVNKVGLASIEIIVITFNCVLVFMTMMVVALKSIVVLMMDDDNAGDNDVVTITVTMMKTIMVTMAMLGIMMAIAMLVMMLSRTMTTSGRR